MKRLQTYQCTIILLVILLLGLVLAISFSGLTLYETYVGQNTPNNDQLAGNQNYQSFTIGTVSTNETFTVKGVMAGIFRSGDAQPANYSFYIFNATNQTTCVFTETVAYGFVYSQVLDASSVNRYNATLAYNGTLMKGRTYCLKVNGTFASGGFVTSTYWQIDRGGTYAGGIAHSNDYGGVWCGGGTCAGNVIDNVFGIYGIVVIPSGLNVTNSRPANNSLENTGSVTFGCNVTQSIGSTSLINTIVLNVSNSSTSWNQTVTGLSAADYNATFINSTIVPNATYFWNCYAFGDTANASSNLWQFNKSNPVPILNIIFPIDNQIYTSLNTINYTIIESNPSNCIFWNGSINTTITCGNNVTGLVPPEGLNQWIIFANNTMGNYGIDVVNFTIHTGTPLIDYNGGTANDGSNLSQNYFNVNVTVIEPLPQNITFYLMLSNGTILSNFSGNNTFNHNFTNLMNDVYYYNVTVCDQANLCNSTSTRRVMIDYQKPLVNILNPTTGTQTPNHNVNFQWNVTDYNNNTDSYSLPQSLRNGLLAYYPLNNNLDKSGNNHNLLNGSGTYGPGKIGNALVNSTIYGQGNFGNFNLQDINSNMTICLWTEGGEGTSSMSILVLANSTNNRIGGVNSMIDFEYANVGTAWQYLTNGGVTVISNTTTKTGWMYHCIIKTPTYLQYILNGSILGTLDYNNDNQTIVQLILGASNTIGNFNWTGKIDEVMIWDRNLTIAELTMLYNNGNGLNTNQGSGVINTTLEIYNQSGSLVNRTTTSIFGNIFNFIVNLPVTLANGIYTFFVGAFDYALNLGVSNNATLIIDDQPPMVNISYPTNTTYTDVVTLYDNTSSRIDWQISDTINFSACWYQIDNGTEITVPCYLNTTKFPLNYSSHNMTFFVNDTSGNKNFTTIFALWKFMVKTNSVTYEPLSTELTSQTFIYNSTLGSTVTGLSTSLNYNHTDYTSGVSSDGLNTLFTNHLITPTVNVKTNFSFFWNITVGDGVTTFNTLSSRYNQTVTPITLGICNETINQTIYNFTAYDEDTLYRIQPFYFGGEFSFSINGSAKKTFTVTNISNEVDICIEPANSIITLNAYVTYDENKNVSQNYTARNYVLQNHVKSNLSENVNLSLLNIFKSTTFTLKVQDKDLVPLANYIINTYRWNPSTSQYYLVQSGRTDSNGLTSGFLEINSVDYKFIITHDDVVELETLISQKVIPQVAPFTLIFTISPTTINPLESLTNITNLNASFANMSNGIQFIYSDTSNNFTQARMIVYRFNYSGPNEIVCNVTSALSTGALSCNFNGINGTYSAIGYITRNGAEFFVDAVNLIFPYGGMGWGLYGVFLGFIMILVSCFAFKFNEIAGIWLVVVTIIFVQLIGFINFGLPFISAVIAVGIIMTVVMKQ